MAPCPACQRHFGNLPSLNQHLKSSNRHADCRRCKDGFVSSDELNRHFLTSHAAVATLSPAERVQHATTLNAVVSEQRPYDGISRALVTPVFKMACNLRFSQPTPSIIIARTRTTLDHDIVSAILEAALRLLPPDSTPEGIRLRREKAADQARRAEAAETSFIDRLSRADTGLLRERQLKERARAALDAGQEGVIRLTPDALLSRPSLICGKVCRWIEYKNTFGFRSSPYVASKNKAQFRKYASTFGSGMVVYKLGFESNHVQIEGVYCFREAEVLQWLDGQAAE